MPKANISQIAGKSVHSKWAWQDGGCLGRRPERTFLKKERLALTFGFMRPQLPPKEGIAHKEDNEECGEGEGGLQEVKYAGNVIDGARNKTNLLKSF